MYYQTDKRSAVTRQARSLSQAGHYRDGYAPARAAMILTALILTGAGWLSPAACNAQSGPPGQVQKLMIHLQAGETYPLARLAGDATPQVRFTDNPNSFVLECGAPGQCSVMGAQAGRGSIRATLETGQPV